MNVLADFKNYTYALPIIRGLVIHMSQGRTDILLPKNRFDTVLAKFRPAVLVPVH